MLGWDTNDEGWTMYTSNDTYSACATYLLENLQEQAPDYSLSKSLELLREGDTDGATFWVNIYLAIVRVADDTASMPSLAIH